MKREQTRNESRGLKKKKKDNLILQIISTFMVLISSFGIKKSNFLILCKRKWKCGLWEPSVTSSGAVHLMVFPRAMKY